MTHSHEREVLSDVYDILQLPAFQRHPEVLGHLAIGRGIIDRGDGDPPTEHVLRRSHPASQI